MDTPTTATLSFTVTDDDTAAALGSGSLPVLATPRLLAWCEAATCAADRAGAGRRRHQRRHPRRARAPRRQRASARRSRSPRPRRTPTGGCTASPSRPGTAPGGKVVATGEITRVVVDAERFLSRL